MHIMGSDGDPLLLQRRARLMDTYTQLQQTHPALPPDLHEFQADITAAAINQQDRRHILSCLPTGMGKTLPMLLTAQLLPPGSTTLLVAPLTSIKQQLLEDCRKLGFTALVGDQLPPAELETELLKRPTVLLVSAEFLASTEVRDVLLNCGLAPAGKQPVVAIDECQVLDEIFGWTGFRSSYGNETWTWLTAALDPKILMSSASLSEDSFQRVCGTLGIRRQDVRVFFKHPQRLNIYQQVRHVKDFSTRFRDETFGFLLPLAASGKKIQVFCPTMEVMDKASRWAKGRFKEAGLGDTPLWKISGGLPVEWKSTVMERFRTSTNGCLFSTDAAAMGVNVPQLCIGVSLGLPQSRWKLVQISGRVGRRSHEQGLFITIIPEKQSFRVSAQGREEFQSVKKMFSSGACINRGLFDSFQIKNPQVTYEDSGAREQCGRCWCCTMCKLDCAGSCGGGFEGEKEDESALRVLGVNSEAVARAEVMRKRFVREAEEHYADDCGPGEDDSGEEEEEGSG